MTNLDLLISNDVLTKSKGSLGTVRKYVSTGRGIYVYNFTKLYIVDLIFNEFVIVEWLS